MLAPTTKKLLVSTSASASLLIAFMLLKKTKSNLLVSKHRKTLSIKSVWTKNRRQCPFKRNQSLLRKPAIYRSSMQKSLARVLLHTLRSHLTKKTHWRKKITRNSSLSKIRADSFQQTETWLQLSTTQDVNTRYSMTEFCLRNEFSKCSLFRQIAQFAQK